MKFENFEGICVGGGGGAGGLVCVGWWIGEIMECGLRIQFWFSLQGSWLRDSAPRRIQKDAKGTGRNTHHPRFGKVCAGPNQRSHKASINYTPLRTLIQDKNNIFNIPLGLKLTKRKKQLPKGI